MSTESGMRLRVDTVDAPNHEPLHTAIDPDLIELQLGAAGEASVLAQVGPWVVRRIAGPLEPALLTEPAGLYALVLALQDDADALGATLSALVQAHPGSALVAALARDLAPEPPAAPVAADPLPDVIAHPAWKEEVAGRKWEAFAGRLPPARVLLAEAVAARAVSAGLLDGDVAGELARRVG